MHDVDSDRHRAPCLEDPQCATGHRLAKCLGSGRSALRFFADAETLGGQDNAELFDVVWL